MGLPVDVKNVIERIDLKANNSRKSVMKDIKGYEGIYAITSCGKVWSYRRKIFLKPGTDRGGYSFVILSLNKVRKAYRVHRLVAEAYLDNPNLLPQVNHKDENKLHNYVNNLEWCDMNYNNNYGTHNDKVRTALSVSVYCVELDKVFEGARLAGRELNINNAHIIACCKGKLKTAGGYHWEYYCGRTKRR